MLRERIGQLAIDLEMVQALGVGEQIESEHAYRASPWTATGQRRATVAW